MQVNTWNLKCSKPMCESECQRLVIPASKHENLSKSFKLKIKDNLHFFIDAKNQKRTKGIKFSIIYTQIVAYFFFK